MEDQREVVFVEEDVGYISGLDRTNTPKYLAAIEFEEIPATFEQLPYILAAGVTFTSLRFPPATTSAPSKN